MSKEIDSIRNMAKEYQKVDTVMYALNKENQEMAKKENA